MTGNAHLCKLP